MSDWLQGLFHVHRHEDRCEMYWERVRRLQEEPHSGDPRFRIHQDHGNHHHHHHHHYLNLQTGDELSKRSKFVFCTWIGDKVKVMEKAKMGTDKALVKAVIEVGMILMVMMAGMMVMVMVIKYNDDMTNGQGNKDHPQYFNLLNES